MKTIAAIIAVMLLAGCVSWPKFAWPWSKDREKVVQKAEAKMDTARDDVLRRSQSDTTVASIAIRSAPESRPVAVAREAIDSAASLQAQALGPVAEIDRQRLEKLVADLLSENAEVRAAAEKDRAGDRAENVRVTALLAKTQASLDDAIAKIRQGYSREKELADSYRSIFWKLIGAIVLALILAAAWIYLRVTTGGALSRIVEGIEHFKGAHPASAPGLLDMLSKRLNEADKAIVRKVAAGVRP